jgi:hypothetical protein
MADDFKYRAYISYSHRDKNWGNWLHKSFESYRVPKRLVGQSGRDGAIPAKLFPVFRDREELPTSSSLSTAIQDALAAAAYLIVICSPRSARSRWVNEEILAFKRWGARTASSPSSSMVSRTSMVSSSASPTPSNS